MVVKDSESLPSQVEHAKISAEFPCCSRFHSSDELLLCIADADSSTLATRERKCLFFTLDYKHTEKNGEQLLEEKFLEILNVNVPFRRALDGCPALVDGRSFLDTSSKGVRRPAPE